MKTLMTLLILTCIPISIYAFHDYEDNEQEKHIEHSFTNQLLNSTEHHLKHVYDYVNAFSKSLDETLTGEKSPYKYENSYVRLETYYDYKESKDNETGINLRVKLRLPQLKERLNLVFENDDDKVGQAYEDSNEKVAYKDDSFSLALEYDKFKQYYNLNFKSGAKLKSNPYVFINAKISKKYDLSSTWSFDMEEKLELNTRNDLENTTSLYFTKRISNRLNFVQFNQYYWDLKHEDNNTHNSVRLSHKLSQKNSFNYVTSVASNDNDTHFQTKQYDAYVAYKHYIRKWLYYDLVPGLYWEREDNFQTQYAFRINIGIIAGK